MKSEYLSKSQFIRGLQCHKSLWLLKNKPSLRAELDTAQQMIFDEGSEVGELACGLFPGGERIIFEGSSFEQKIAKTQELIKSGAKTIYEATFFHDGVLCMVDILNKSKKGWDIYEVKSSSQDIDAPKPVKEVHENDLALQYHVLAGNGLKVSSVNLVLLNKGYIHRGKYILKKLFIIEDMKNRVKAKQVYLKKELKKLRRMLREGKPKIDIGSFCEKPYICDFYDHCWTHIPQCSIFNIARLGNNEKFALYGRGIVKLKDIPEDYPLGSQQKLQVETALNGKKIINKKAISQFLEQIHYPLYFLDFETFNPAIPRFEGQHPREVMPFQYSLHYQLRNGGKLHHKEFLAKEGADPKLDLATHLAKDIPSGTCVIAYHSGFEKGIICKLANQFPKLKSRLMKIHANILDLEVPFRKMHYYTREMQCSSSIKNVLPALIPSMSYDGMEISDGKLASNIYAGLHRLEDKKEVARLKGELRKYCELDTLAMVRLLEKLYKAVV